MGDVQSLPVVGEAVTAVDVGVRVSAAGACLIFGNTDAADKLMEGAGNTLTDYTEKSIIVAPLNAELKHANGDEKEANRIYERSKGALEGVVDSTPVVGHLKGAYHYAAGDEDHGNRCMMRSSRSSVVIAGGLVTGGVGGVFGGVTFDTCASAATNEPQGNLKLIAKAGTTDDPNDYVDVYLGLGSDFATGKCAKKAKDYYSTRRK